MVQQDKRRLRDARGSIQRSSLFLSLIGVGLFALGCQRGSSLPSNPPVPPTTEASLAEQWDQVAARKADGIFLVERAIGDADLDRLSEGELLKTLVVDEGKLTDEGCARIALQSGLVHLRLRHSPITDAGLKHLLTCQQLEILNLPQSQVSDEGIALLSRFPKLRFLRIGSPGITAQGLKHLKEVPSLAQIHLIDIDVTDAGLDELASIPKLQSLYIDGATFSDEAVSRLFDKHPKLHVHFDQRHHDRDPNRHDH